MFELGLIGKKLGHSFSADYFNNKFSREGIDGIYSLFPRNNLDDIREFIEARGKLVGLNVTIPYKEKIICKLDGLSEAAESIGAVNVIAIDRTSDQIILTGHNTDWSGFAQSLHSLVRPDIKSALILGTGGASKAVAYALKKEGIKITFVSRTPADFKGSCKFMAECMSYDDIDRNIIEDNLLIVNTTPLGMHPDTDSFPPIPYEYIGDRHLCYDLVYNPLKTKFLELAEASGARIKNGLEMLHLQADMSWDIWKPMINSDELR